MEYHSKKPNKIRQIVRLQQILKKWRKLAKSSSSSSSSKSSISSKPSSGKSTHFLKRTISFSDNNISTTNSHEAATSLNNNNSSSTVPKGYLAVCVGEEQKRFVIPTEYLGRQAFHVLLREAEEEFGFKQMGVLRIPCEVSVFERVLKMVQDQKRQSSSSYHDDQAPLFFLHEYYCGVRGGRSSSTIGVDKDVDVLGCWSSDSPLLGFSHHSDHHSPLCR